MCSDDGSFIAGVFASEELRVGKNNAVPSVITAL